MDSLRSPGSPLPYRRALPGDRVGENGFELPTVTVLIVEDEPALRKLVRRVLEADGKRVLEAADGHEALAVLELEHGAIDLLITDVTMPGMNGLELVEQASARWPALRCVCSSGSERRFVRSGIDAGAVDLLRKPYTIAGLRRRVAQELAASSGSSV